MAVWWKKDVPLIDVRATEECGQMNLLDSTVGGDHSIYFGIGLTGAKEISAGLPVDVLSMLYAAEYARKQLNWSGKIYVLLADTHAIEAGRPADVINERATAVEHLMSTIVENLPGYGPDHTEVIRASSYQDDPSYRDLLDSIQAREYKRHQQADCAYMVRKQGVRLKISWCMGAKSKSNRDERTWDLLFQNLFREPLSFLYVEAGRTFDPLYPKMAPYLTQGENRLLLSMDINVGKFFTDLDPQIISQMKGTVTYLQNLTRLWEMAAGTSTPRSSLACRLDFILDLALNGDCSSCGYWWG